MNLHIFRQKRDEKEKLQIIWLLILLSIPLLSFYGRTLQLFLLTHFSTELLTLCLGGILAGMVGCYLIALFKSGVHPHVYHLLWLGALVLFIYLRLPFVEKIHIAIFGIFGFLSLKLLGQKTALIVCVLISLLDELFQHFLSARVGDWRDVGINIFSAFLGMFLAFLLIESSRRRLAKESASP